MKSEAWKLAELVRRIAKLEAENRKLQRQAAEGRRAMAERDKMAEKLKAAESARHAADRAREKEHYARLNAEEDRDRLYSALKAAHAQESRIARLVRQYG